MGDWVFFLYVDPQSSRYVALLIKAQRLSTGDGEAVIDFPDLAEDLALIEPAAAFSSSQICYKSPFGVGDPIVPGGSAVQSSGSCGDAGGDCADSQINAMARKWLCAVTLYSIWRARSSCWESAFNSVARPLMRSITHKLRIPMASKRRAPIRKPVSSFGNTPTRILATKSTRGRNGPGEASNPPPE